MLDYNDGGSVTDQSLKYVKQCADVQGMKSDGRLVEDENGIGLGFSHLAGKLQPLGLAAGQTGSFFAQGQVSKAQIFKHLQPLPHQFQILAGLKGPAYVQHAI